MVLSHFYDRELDEVAFKAAKRSIGEAPEFRSKGLQALKKKLLNVDGLLPCLDDEYLLRYLRVAKFDVNKAFARILKYYTCKKQYSLVFDKFYPSAAPTALDAQHFLASPWRLGDNSVLVIFKRGLYNPSTMNYEEMFILDCLIFDHLTINPLTQVCGTTFIIDFEGYSFKNFFEDTPRRVKMAVDTFQNSFPLRFKSIHIVNAPRIFSLLYNICFPFMTKKISSRLHFHSNGDDWKRLHDFIHPEILPKAYGGTMPDSDLIDLSQEVIKEEEYFKEQLQYGFSKKKTGLFC